MVLSLVKALIRGSAHGVCRFCRAGCGIMQALSSRGAGGGGGRGWSNLVQYSGVKLLLLLSYIQELYSNLLLVYDAHTLPALTRSTRAPMIPLRRVLLVE